MLGRPALVALGALLALLALAGALLQALSPETRERTFADDPLVWFLYPIERNAFARLPTVRGHLIGASLSADGERGVALGVDGRALITANGGVTWRAVDTGPTRGDFPAVLQTIDLSQDGMRGVAVGRGGIRTTADGGATWALRPTTADVLRSVAVSANGERAVAVGQGTLLVSADGGATWASRNVGDVDLISVALSADGRHAIAVGDSVLVTRDGGTTWIAARTASPLYHDVDISADGRRGMVVGARGQVLTTIDYGVTWTARRIRIDRALSSVAVSGDGMRGMALASGLDAVLLTNDGGASWSAHALHRNLPEVADIALSEDGLRGMIVAQGAILTTTDGGANWAARSSGANEGHSLALSADGNTAYVLGFGGLMRTLDGGTTWTITHLDANLPIEQLAISANGERLVAAGQRGTVATMDARSAAWTLQDTLAAGDAAAVAISADGNRAAVVTRGGTLETTINGGASWTTHMTETAILQDVTLSDDGSRGIALGWGQLLVTGDGGANWVNRPVEMVSNSVALSANGRRGVMVGDGTIHVTTDGGATWTARSAAVDAALLSVALSDDGLTGAAVGLDGILLTTADGGASWTQRDSAGQADLISVALSADGMRGMALGVGKILVTEDGGSTWRHVAARRYPAPWTYPIFALSLGLVGLGLKPVRRSSSGIADIGVSDNPVERPDEDRLGRATLARDLSAFLRNRDTKPPLTLAIMGDWGSGKSSIMRMLCHDMRRFGGRPVWFNAWHHEQEEHLLAALWAAIRAQAPPSWWTLDGIAFRLRLLARRAGRNIPTAILVLLIAALFAGSLRSGGLEPWRAFLERLFGAEWRQAVGALPGPLAQLGALAAIVAALVKALRAFGTSPGLLARSAIGNLNLRQANLAVGARATFEREFAEVSGALPQPMLIVIDDLDRCRSETVATVLESVNFLVTCGQCFVVLGMAREVVQRSIGLSFKEIAAETGEADGEDGSNAARRMRRQYAAAYLEKLINIEIDVPSMTQGDSQRLLTGDPRLEGPAGGHVANRVWRPLRALATAAALFAIIGTGHWIGGLIEPPAPEVAVATPVADAPPVSASAAPTAPTPRPDLQASPSNLRWEPLAVVPGPLGGQHPWVILILMLAALMTVSALLYFRLRQVAREVRDSAAFVGALDRWGKVLDANLRTPRSVRRFGNRVRLLAMRQRPPEDRRSIGEEMRRVAGAWWRRRISKSSGDAEPMPAGPEWTLDEATLVALGTLSELYPNEWRAVAMQDAGTFPDELMRDAAADPDQPWPVAANQIETFESLARGIRVRAG